MKHHTRTIEYMAISLCALTAAHAASAQAPSELAIGTVRTLTPAEGELPFALQLEAGQGIIVDLTPLFSGEETAEAAFAIEAAVEEAAAEVAAAAEDAGDAVDAAAAEDETALLAEDSAEDLYPSPAMRLAGPAGE